MGLVTLTRDPTSTPSWISLPGPKARTVREERARREEEAGGADTRRRGADDDAVDRAATHRRDAAEAVVCMLFWRPLFQEQRERCDLSARTEIKDRKE